jgi:hypothetical protein
MALGMFAALDQLFAEILKQEPAIQKQFPAVHKAWLETIDQLETIQRMKVLPPVKRRKKSPKRRK